MQLRYIFKIYGWHEPGYLPQSLRFNWQRFHKKYEAMLLDGGAKGLGHANTRTTGRSYDADDVHDLVRIARATALAIRGLSGERPKCERGRTRSRGIRGVWGLAQGAQKG